MAEPTDAETGAPAEPGAASPEQIRAERYDHLPEHYRLLTDQTLSDRTARLLSRDRADHPHADDLPCVIRRVHDPHPYGGIHPDGGLRYWCAGQPEETHRG